MLRAAIALLASVMFVGTAVAARSLDDPRGVVINARIGSAWIGEQQDRVVYTYGEGCMAGCPGVGGYAYLGVSTFTYRVHGATLTIDYRRGRVIHVDTTAPYYRSADGSIFVGARIPFGATWHGFRRLICGGSGGPSMWRKRGASVSTRLYVQNGRITDIEIERNDFPRQGDCP